MALNANAIIGDVLDGVQDLVELADRGLAKLFNEPWPPVKPSPCYYSPRSQHVKSCRADARRTTSVVAKTYSKAPLSRPPAKQALKKAPIVRKPADNVAKCGAARLSAPTSLKLKKPSLSSSAHFSKSSPVKLARAGLRYDNSAPSGNKLDSKVVAPSKPATTQLESKPPQSKKPGIRLDDIQPDLGRCDVLIIAVAEMEICKEIFAGWRAQLDLSTPRQTDKLEQSITSSVNQLDSWASAALQSSHDILRSYRAFARVVDKRLDELARSKGGGPLFLSSELRTLSSRLFSHSKALASHVKKMQEGLRQLVSDIEKTKALADKRALRRKIWGWVAKAFKALSAILSAGGAIFAFFYPVGILESAAIAGASMFSGAVAHLCNIVQDKYSETTFDEILVFLRDHVPESAKAAELALTSFQACQRVLQLELEVRQGKRADWVSVNEARRSRDQWAQAYSKMETVIARRH